jgi:putative transposase
MRGFASLIEKRMNLISPNSPAYYLTSVTKDRLPAFRLDKLKSVACDALTEARTSGGFLIFAYVIMPDHFHLISDSEKKPAKVLQFVNGIVSRRVIDFLKQHGHGSSLKKLQHQEYRRGHKYSLWDHHPNVRLLTSENMLMERVQYTHQNPVSAGLVNRAEDYFYSSVRIWNRMPLEDEPLTVDLGKLRLRTGHRKVGGIASRT